MNSHPSPLTGAAEPTLVDSRGLDRELRTLGAPRPHSLRPALPVRRHSRRPALRPARTDQRGAPASRGGGGDSGASTRPGRALPPAFEIWARTIATARRASSRIGPPEFP